MIPTWTILAGGSALCVAAGFAILAWPRVERWRLVRAEVRGLDAELEKELTA